MKLSEFREAYQELSAKASEVARSLAFAGIAIVWIYKVGGEASPRPRPGMLLPTALLVLGLALDLLQYVYATAAFGAFTRLHERALDNVSEDPDVDAPRQINWPTMLFFWGKLVCIAIAYVLLAARLGHDWVVTVANWH